ncbi:caspase domain-containing protein [Lentzea sp. NPDC058436]|uniref:caspase family protein n=1 Tax=Lentzea sp. NPDC058436 TaxID=3346499 RepID=UPI0036526911
MTTVFEERGSGPRTHAFVVGVGDYPYCADFDGDGALASAVRNFKPVAGPPPSARAVASWLVENQAGKSFAPLGSVELLVSGEDSPTVENFRMAFERWYSRCDENEDNVALFFFSGHGCQKEGQLILLEDFGRWRNPFEGALKIETFAAGMEQCRAKVQCYFVDACRNLPHELLESPPAHTFTPILPDVVGRARESVILFGTAPGATAPGSLDGPTPFTVTLLQALEGAAATKDHSGQWVIRTGDLVTAMNAVIEWQSGESHGVWAGGGFQGNRPIRHLDGVPAVPFRLGCDPREALACARLVLTCPDTSVVLSREPLPALWEDRTPAAVYLLNACFDGADYNDACSHYMPVHPPNLVFDLRVCGA